jgi:hypothetical protein
MNYNDDTFCADSGASPAQPAARTQSPARPFQQQQQPRTESPARPFQQPQQTSRTESPARPFQQQPRTESPARPFQQQQQSAFKAGPSSSPVPRPQPKPLVTPNQPPMQSQSANAGEWQNILDSNKAGAAGNAEDFTKQFMSDFFGKAPGMSHTLEIDAIAKPEDIGRSKEPVLRT